MTSLMKQLIDKLQEIPEEEQDDVAAPLMEELHTRHKAEDPEDEIEPYASFEFLRKANLDLPPDASVTYERDLYGRTADLDD